MKRMIAAGLGCAVALTGLTAMPAQAAEQTLIVHAVGETYECDGQTLNAVSGSYLMRETLQEVADGFTRVTGSITINEEVVLVSEQTSIAYTMKPLSGNKGATTFDVVVSHDGLPPVGTFDAHWQFKGGKGVATVGTMHTYSVFNADGTLERTERGSCKTVKGTQIFFQ
ncbi:MAG: hypothetical protein Q4G46_09450 [Propionibacteriaceae bacterium]|nr:hypothetical protein [Propionibacteriaceae bacterium]